MKKTCIKPIEVALPVFSNTQIDNANEVIDEVMIEKIWVTQISKKPFIPRSALTLKGIEILHVWREPYYTMPAKNEAKSFAPMK